MSDKTRKVGRPYRERLDRERLDDQINAICEHLLDEMELKCGQALGELLNRFRPESPR